MFPDAVILLTTMDGESNKLPALSAILACEEDTSFTISWDADIAKRAWDAVVANDADIAVPKRLPVIPSVMFNEPENIAGPIFVKVEEPDISNDPVIVWSPIKIFDPVVAKDPVSIVFPGGPCDPDGPCGPCGPCEPDGPDGPVRPIGPVSPLWPWGPRDATVIIFVFSWVTETLLSVVFIFTLLAIRL